MATTRIRYISHKGARAIDGGTEGPITDRGMRSVSRKMIPRVTLSGYTDRPRCSDYKPCSAWYATLHSIPHPWEPLTVPLVYQGNRVAFLASPPPPSLSLSLLSCPRFALPSFLLLSFFFFSILSFIFPSSFSAMKSYDHEAAFDVPGNEIPLKLPVISSPRCAHVGSNYAPLSLSLVSAILGRKCWKEKRVSRNWLEGGEPKMFEGTNVFLCDGWNAWNRVALGF